METLAGVIPRGDLGMELQGDHRQERFTLTCNDPKGIALQVDGETVMRLEIDFLFAPDREGKWLKVMKSTFAVVPEGSGTPYFRYDFLSDAKNVPSAHINIHAHRDDLIAALVGTGKSSAAKSRRKGFVNSGQLPRVSNFHFPVGGTRFRPCLEDVLEATIVEFGLDCSQGFQQVLIEGKQRYRDRQLQAIIRDRPEVALEALRSLGYEVQAQP